MLGLVQFLLNKDKDKRGEVLISVLGLILLFH